MKIGGTLGKLGNKAKETVKDAAKATSRSVTDPTGQLGSQINATISDVTGGLKIPSAAEIGRKLSINTLLGKEKKDQKAKDDAAGKIAAKQQVKTEAQARIDAGGGTSSFMNTADKYLAQYGDGINTANAILADTTTNAYQPLVGQLQGMANGDNIDPAFRNYQLGLAQQLQQQASGQGPSIAQMQLQQATDRSLNQSLGAIRSATGANAGLSARTAALAGAQQLGSAANASGQLRLQEQQQAQQALGTLTSQGRAGDQDIRNGQLTATSQLRGAIGDQISGTTQAYQGIIGLDAAGIEAKRLEKQKAKENDQKLGQAGAGAVLNGLTTYIAG